MKYLVTGAAGFIGHFVSVHLIGRGDEIVGIDNLNDYYDVGLKEARLAEMADKPGFTFIKMDLADRSAIEELFNTHRFDRVIHLAAQAGVRYSIDNPHAYASSNLVGFLNILEGCRHHKVAHLCYASSSSVYGANKVQPFSEHHNVDHPVSLYAATKKSNELMAHTYASLYQLPVTGLRFFTVYGPFGRPDMAYFKFTKKIFDGEPIDVYNNGDMYRDFTYIDDIVEGVVRISDKIPSANSDWTGEAPDPASSYCPYRVYNIGNNQPEKLMDFIQAIENATGQKAVMNMMPMQPGDVPSTAADTQALEQDIGFKPNTSIQEGINRFVSWYREYYSV